MEFKKIVLIMLLCAGFAVDMPAKAPWKLPQAHTVIADAQVEANLGLQSPFVSEAFNELGSRTPFAGIFKENRKDAVAVTADPKASRMVDYAARFLGTRYRLGASGPKAFDCSGFTSYVFKNFGITLSRSSRSQFLQGEKVSVDNLRPGDLLFFGSRSSGRGNVGHVAMVVEVDPVEGSCKFIHASVKYGVTYQKFPDGGYYSRNFIGARRILGTSHDTSSDMAVR